MIYLSSSSFFLSEYLTKKINTNSYSAAQFSYALKIHNIAALTIAVNETIIGDSTWLLFNKLLAKTNSDASLKLAHWYQHLANTKFKQQVLGSEQYSEQGEVDLSRAKLWFEQAIRLNSQQAVIALSQLYFQQGDISKAQSTLGLLNERVIDDNIRESALLLRFNMAIYSGDIATVNQLLNAYELNKTESNRLERGKLSSLVADLFKYHVVETSFVESNAIVSDKQGNSDIATINSYTENCLTSLQLFATNLEHLRHLDKLIAEFKATKALAKFVCLATPRYISKLKLQCTEKSSQAIICNESQWLAVADNVESKHVGLLLETGGANVHLGILYVDATDDVNVLNHEISHLLGFVDEYPLIANHSTCQKVQTKQFAHNIAVLKKYYQGDRKNIRAHILKDIPWAGMINVNTPILQRVSEEGNNTWQLGTPYSHHNEVGMFVSETCQKSTMLSQLLAGKELKDKVKSATDYFTAYKPLNKLTQLRYYKKDFPAEYLTLLSAKPSSHLMPSFHYNIALALYQQRKIADAKVWLEKSAQWETTDARKKIILKGEF
ncbi:hypothetical protein [Colwellia sp. E2M01]|uniref:hypothetical protein n=1 Tax=Colwellia sp. E2M01 TaxID=2841561 RepID=UPI001C09D1A2|nr:hypothetical protein [Colwellia sp. E2M01]MBU2872285.1 hypothetical protein [Colwellia sp. E2M01]